MKLQTHLPESFFNILLAIFLTALCSHARTWTSADGQKTFEGELVEYNEKTGQVTVDVAGKKLTFKEQVLSVADVDYLKNGKAAATNPKPSESPSPKPAAFPAAKAPASTSAPANNTFTSSTSFLFYRFLINI